LLLLRWWLLLLHAVSLLLWLLCRQLWLHLLWHLPLLRVLRMLRMLRMLCLLLHLLLLHLLLLLQLLWHHLSGVSWYDNSGAVYVALAGATSNLL